MQILNDLQSDYKAELLASTLLKEEDDLTKIIIKRLGNNARPHTKDVYKIYESLDQLDLTNQIVIETFRQSIYDALPENLFHPPTLGGLGKTQEEIVLEIQHQQRKEQEARKFFLPFEQESSYIEIQALLIELMFDKKVTHNHLLDLFKQEWPILKELPRMTALAFIYILPILNEVRGNKVWIEKCLSFILGYPINIIEKYTTQKIEPSTASFTTGKCNLGLNTNLPGAQYDGIAEWEIKVGPVPEEKIQTVLPGSAFRKLFNLLLDFFTPIHIFTTYSIHSKKQKQTTFSTEAGSARLGYTFYL
ncbi:MAG TPA: type VI secretion system baseplate subunit TssG [Chitinophagaceae bacterium]|nr:type VI secretion system baseplate subunit TssG [Chitinophagaceae bacterium]